MPNDSPETACTTALLLALLVVSLPATAHKRARNESSPEEVDAYSIAVQRRIAQLNAL